MLETLLGLTSAIVLGVAGNLLTPYVRDLLHLPPEKETPPPATNESSHPIPPNQPADIEALRARNRAQLHAIVWQAYLYGSAFYFVFMAIYLPLNFSTPLHGDLDLSHTRLGIVYTLSQDRFTTFSALLAFILYIPVWLAAQKISQVVANIWRRFIYVGPYRFGALVTLTVSLLSMVIAGHLIFLLYPSKTYVGSVLFPFILLFVVGAFAALRR